MEKARKLKSAVKAIYHRPYLILLAVFILTIFAFAGIARTKQEFGYKAMLPRDAESVKALEEAERLFGGTSEEQVLIECSKKPGAALWRLVQEYPEHVSKNPRLWGSFVKGVTTPLDSMYYFPKAYEGVQGANASIPGASGESEEAQVGQVGARGMSAGAVSLSRAAPGLSDDELLTQVELNLRLIRNEKQGRSSGSGGGITPDGRVLLITARINPEADLSTRMKAADVFVSDTLSYFSGVEGARVYVGGESSMNSDSNRRTMRDTRLLFSLAFLFILLVILLTFRRLSDLLFTISVVLIAVIWVMGAGGWLGFAFTYQSVAILPLMLGINIAYAIHVLTRYYEERRKGESPETSVFKSVRTVGIAVFLTAMTTAFGFSSFSISSMPPVRNFGILCVCGVIFSFILSESLLPAELLLRDRRKKVLEKADRRMKAEREKSGSSIIEKVLARVSIIAEHHRIIVFTVTLLILIACGVLSVRISTEADFEKMLPRDMPSIVAMRRINRYFGGQGIAYSIVKGDVLDPRTLRSMLDFEEAVGSYGGRNDRGELLLAREKIVSIADLFVKAAGGLPWTKADARKKLAVLREGGMAESVDRLISRDGRVALITFRVASGSQDDMKEITEVIRERSSVFGAGTIMHGGMPVLMTDLLGNLLPTQIRTALLALLLCSLLVMLVFRSVSFGIAAASVVLIGLALEIGALAVLGWPLDFMTVMVSSLVIGAGIDFGIHVTHRFREEWRNGEVDVDSALRNTVVNVGRALIAAATTTAGAFAIIAISNISYLRRFGGITALALVFALLGSLLFLPSLLGLIADTRKKRAQGA